MKIFNRNQLLNEYQDILDKSNLVKHGLEFKAKTVDNCIITQSTSGSCNQPLIIPRYYNDLADVINRFLSYYVKYFGKQPQKVAMLGGISHIKAASSIKIDGTKIQFFDFLEFSKVLDWEPEIITCYPSILREVLYKYGTQLNFLKAIKVGGEKLFPADCVNTFNLLPDMLIIEQYGSTELPALAFRNITQDNFQSRNSQVTIPFELQEKRFSYLNMYKEGWHPLIAKDNFPELLFKIEDYYDTGDEAFWIDYVPVDFRRRNVIENDYCDHIDHLLIENFINLQLDLQNRFIITEHFISESVFRINNRPFLIKNEQLKRISPSNKLPLIVNNQKSLPSTNG